MRMSFNSLCDLFYDNLHLHMEEVAVIFNDGKCARSITYSNLEQLASEICNNVKTLGIEKQIIAVFTNNDILVPSLLLGILKSSSSFLVLHVSKDPCTFIELIGVNYIFVQNELFDKVQQTWTFSYNKFWEWSTDFGSFILLKSFQADCSKPCLKQLNSIHLNELAYVIETSGTTGLPKTVFVPHQCIIPNIINLRRLFSISPDDVVFNAAPLTFDPSVVEIFISLTSGAKLLIVPNALKSQTSELVNVLMNHKVTILQATPSLIQNIGCDRCRSSLFARESSLRILALGGERCPSTGTLRSWRASGNLTKMYNLYGITEVSAWATCFQITESLLNCLDSEIPIGDPLDDTCIEIRNERGLMVGPGEGELFIGGPKRACSIFTDMQFCHTSEAAMISTGDWVRRDEKGNIFFVGRKDRIVKYNGRKIDLAGIQSLIARMEIVNGSCVLFDKRRRIVVVFVIPKTSSEMSKINDDVVNLLRTSAIGADSIPFLVTVVTHIPLTLHGKVDEIKLLNNLTLQPQSSKNLIKCVDIQDKIEEMWKRYLGIYSNSISNNSNFILCGGDSASAAQFSTELELHVHTELPLLLDKLLNSTYGDVLSYVTNILSGRKPGVKSIKRTRSAGESDGSKKLHSTGMTKVRVMSRNEPEHDKDIDNSSGSSRSDTDLSVLKHTIHQKVCASICFEKCTRRGKQCTCNCSNCSQSNSVSFSDARKKGSEQLDLVSVWKYDLLKCVDASPLIVQYRNGGDDVVFIGSHSGKFAALELATGTLFWEIWLSDRIESSADLSWCGKHVVVGCYDHHIYCFYAEDGNLKWKFKTGAEVKSSPVSTHAGYVLCGSHDHNVYALQIGDGSCIWKTKVGEGSVFSSPCVSVEPFLVYAASLNGSVGAFCPVSGVCKWIHKCSQPIFSSPLAVKEGVCTCCVNGQVFFWDHYGHLKWSFQCQGFVFSSACFVPLSRYENKSAVVVGSHCCTVYCLCISSGSLLWTFDGTMPYYATASWLSEENRIVVVNTAGKMDILDETSGISTQDFQLEGKVFSSPVVCDSFVLLGCRNNFMYCLKTIRRTHLE